MKMDRRRFLMSTLMGAGGLLLVRPGLAAAPAPAPGAGTINPFELVPLGKTGLKVSRIGFGTGMSGGMRQSNQVRLGKEKFEALIKAAWDRGVRLFDMADMYGTHEYVGRVLKDLPRDQYVLSTKIWVNAGNLPELERPDANVVVDRFRKELQTDVVDLVLLHCMTSPKWPGEQRRMMDGLAALKAKGVIRAHGISAHSIPALEAAAESPWVDSVHARINHLGVRMDGLPEQVAPVLDKLHKAGKGVVGMKIVGEGTFRDDEKKNASIRYVLGLGSVDAMVVGFEKPEEIDDFAPRVAAVLKAKA